ncbi:MAG: LacI family DNA-binding transcriptional regulator [Clostridia bacterium]|nr:LacI family DNA-binding transcriptional regulator [Clostridia bacterium]
MVTLKDVAAACGVSPATVSRALNATGDNPSRHVRHIRLVAGSMGYRPNAAARALKTNRSDNIGILYEDVMQHEYFSSLIEGLRLGAEKRGYDLTFLTRHFEGEGKVYVAEAEYRSLDGIIVVQADYASSRILSLSGCGLPTVVVDNRLEGCGTVFSDNADGMEKLVRHIASLGHRRVAFIGGDEGSVTSLRLGGFYKGCAESGLRVAPEWIFHAHYRDPQSCFGALDLLLSGEVKPTCILFPDDFCCIGAISALAARGIRVPEDISIAGYDGVEMGRLMKPVLTTYRQDSDGMADLAIQMLTDAISKGEQSVSGIATAEGSLVEGETVQRIGG